jgi:hypothetical protein
MTLRPKGPMDLSLAPVAAHLDMNLARIRDCPVSEIEFQIALELDRPERSGTVQERMDRLVAMAVRNVELHGWTVAVTDDHCRMRMSGGSVSLDLGLSAEIMRYLEAGRSGAA